MSKSISVEQWLLFLDSEYLSSFIRDGGASIKFAVTSEELKPSLYQAITTQARDQGYLVVDIDAADCRAHMPQDVFFEIAKQVNWRHLARRCVLKLARNLEYDVDHIDPNAKNNIFEEIGATKGLDSTIMLNHVLMRPLQDNVYRNLQMAKDFRVAMSHLCQREDIDGDDQYTGQPLLDWLTGDNTRLSNVKPFQIYTGINRTTARHFIESALYWFQYVGYTGTVLLLDNSRVTLPRNPRDGQKYYTKTMTIDHYQLLREFIDGTDQLTGTLLLVVTNNEFLDEDARTRGFGIYPALMTRVMDDVRDKNLVNPIASLIRLS